MRTFQQAIDEAIEARLNEMRNNPKPAQEQEWADGCYGSLRSVLLFVGASPGTGGRKFTDRHPRGMHTYEVLWNEPYRVPYDEATGKVYWGTQYKRSIPPLLETITGHRLNDGLDKLYGFANFDWLPSGVGMETPVAAMRDGMPVIWNIISQTRPLLIVALQSNVFPLLRELIENHGFCVGEEPQQSTLIRTPRKKKSYHRIVNVHRITTLDPNYTPILVRLPQHPAKMMMDVDYAYRCARAVRKACETAYYGEEMFTVLEE
jgi:hypothetical protein